MTMLSGISISSKFLVAGWVYFICFSLKIKVFFLYCSLGAIVKIKCDMETIKY